VKKIQNHCTLLPTSAVQIDDLALSWIGEYTPLPPCLA
jgi:hypothetical protein